MTLEELVKKGSTILKNYPHLKDINIFINVNGEDNVINDFIINQTWDKTEKKLMLTHNNV